MANNSTQPSILEVPPSGGTLPRLAPLPEQSDATAKQDNKWASLLITLAISLTAAGLLLYLVGRGTSFFLQSPLSQEVATPVPQSQTLADGTGCLYDLRDSSTYAMLRVGKVWITEPLRWQSEDGLYTLEEALKACPKGWKVASLEQLSGLFTVFEYPQIQRYPPRHEQAALWRYLLMNHGGFRIAPKTDAIPNHLRYLTNTPTPFEPNHVYAFELKVMGKDTTVTLTSIQPHLTEAYCLCTKTAK